MQKLVLLLSALALAAPAAADAMTSDSTYTAAPLVVLVDTIEPPAPPAAACPSVPASADPVDGCPPDFARLDANNDPVACNYFSGHDLEPCPHANPDYFIVRCVDGTIYHVARDDTGEGGDPAYDCGGPFEVLEP